MSPPAHVLVKRAMGRAQAVPTDPTQWGPLLADLHAAFGACGTALFTPEPCKPGQAVGLGHGDVVDGIAPYFSHWGRHDAWNLAVAGRALFQRAGEIRFGHEFLADDPLRRTAFFNDWARRYNAEQLISIKLTDQRDSLVPVVHLTFFRRFVDARYTPHDRARLERLRPYLQHALQASALLAPVHRAAHPVEAMLDDVSSPTWVVGDDGQIEFANRAACTLMQDGAWVKVRHHRVCRLGEIDAADLKMCMLRGMFGGASLGVTATSAVVDGHLQCRILRVMPIRESPLYAQQWPRACALLTLEALSDAYRDLWRKYLQERFNLTPTLSDILTHIGTGLDIHEIAKARGKDEGTIKRQVSDLRARTGVKRYGDLVRLALGQ